MKRRTWMKAGGFLLCLCVFFGVVINLQNDGLRQFDLSITEGLASMRTPQAVAVMQGLSALCAPVVLLAICFALMLLYRRKHYSIPIAINLMVSVSLNYSLKNIFLRERPPLIYRAVTETGYSFPSGHAMAAGAFYGFLIYIVAQSKLPRRKKRWLIGLLGLLIFLIGLSRVYLGVHYFSDVLAGFAVSIAYLILYSSVVGLYLHAGLSEWVSPVEDHKSKHFTDSFMHALDGVAAGFKSERNMIIHFAAMALVTVFGFLLGLSQSEWLTCVILFGLVIGMELMNTAIETAVDLSMPHHHPRAKVAKDTSAGAVLLVCIAAVVAGAIIFVPKLLRLL